jgi:tetratricopeptide (TPR) repeat protein
MGIRGIRSSSCALLCVLAAALQGQSWSRVELQREDLFFPRPARWGGSLRFAPGLGGPRAHLLEAAAFPRGARLEFAVELPTHPAGLAIVLGPDLDAELGTAVEFRIDGELCVAVVQRRPAGRDELAVRKLGSTPLGRRTVLAAEIRDGRVHAEFAGQAIWPGGVPVPASYAERRLALEVHGATFRVSELRLEAPGPPTGALAFLDAAPLRWPEELRLPALPWAGPIDQVDEEVLYSGLGERARQDVLALRTPQNAGTATEAAERASALADAWPAARGAALLAGARWLLDVAEPAPALRYLQRAPDLVQSSALRGDALWLAGRLDEASREYDRAGEPASSSGRALVAWARGDAARARELAAAAPRGRCRLADLRLHLLRLVGSLLPGDGAHGPSLWPGLHQARGPRVRVSSDSGRGTAERCLEDAQAFQARLRSLFPALDACPEVLVLACARPELYLAWNEALGGARFDETSAVYRPGLRLIILRDDGDRPVVRHRLWHELVHHEVHHEGLLLPPVFEEGLCEWLAWVHRAAATGSYVPTLPCGRRPAALRILETGRPIEVDTVLRESPRDGAGGEEDYLVAWAIVDLLARGPGGSDPARLRPILHSLTAEAGVAGRRAALAGITGEAVRARLRQALR